MTTECNCRNQSGLCGHCAAEAVKLEFPFPDADAAVRRAELADARKLYVADPVFRDLTKEYLAEDLDNNPGQYQRNYAQEALLAALHEWEYVEPEQPAHEYRYEQTPEGHRLGGM